MCMCMCMCMCIGTLTGLGIIDINGDGYTNIEDSMTGNDLIVYCGEMMSYITKGFYRPLLHRAVSVCVFACVYVCMY